MSKKRTWKQYRAIDLAMFAIMLIICEFIIVMAARFWFPGQPYTVSLAAAIVTIVYMRWGWWGAIHAVLAGIVFCFFQGASSNQYLIYTAGNLFSLISVFMANIGAISPEVANAGLLNNPAFFRSIHSGCGTSNYTFIWAMGGENQAFDDMDNLRPDELR